MTRPVDICSLDYLIGTIATAYKGMITSLVAKDFCIAEEAGEMTIKGTILSMPQGQYEARLMHEGSELARSGLRDGYFELRAQAGVVTEAKNLQIDIVQRGRHIGTLLLKREKQGEFFVPAEELSEELKRIDLKQLTARLQGKVGLLKKAEDIISEILSPKKNWRKFSEKVNSFSHDIFWAERDTFYGSYQILARYSRLACEKLGDGKLLSNFLSLASLPLEKERDSLRLRGLVETWLAETKHSKLDLTLRLNQSYRVLKSINEKFPGMDIDFVLRMLLSSLKKKAEGTPVIEKDVLEDLEDVLSGDDYDKLMVYGEDRRVNLGNKIRDMEKLAPPERRLELLERTGLPGPMPDERDMVRDFFDVIEENLRPGSAEQIAGAVLKALEGFLSSSPEVSRMAAAGTVRLIRNLIGTGLGGTCATFMRRMADSGLVHGTDLLLDREMAQALLSAGSEELLQAYEDIATEIIIPAPRVSGFSADTWAEIANPLHIERLREFMRVISLDRLRFRALLVHTVCNLYVSGVFIPDESLFQREISGYLNSGAPGDNFLLDHLLLQRLPVYFNEVGATGRIRDYTTRIDSWGNDSVLYFLRKQVHVNASNYNIRLIEKIMECWTAEDPGLLEGSVPEEVLRRMDTALLRQYASAIRPFFRSVGLLDKEGLHPERLLGIEEEDIRRKLKSINTTDEIMSKIFLLCRLYQEVTGKYSPVPADLKEEDIEERLPHYVERMKELKDVILSSQRTEPEESLYFKRHIAFGIPSVMGSYHEPKFNAMGRLLQEEECVRVVLEEIAASIGEKKDDVSGRELAGWIGSLATLNELFHLFGLGNFQVDEIIAILRTNSLHRSQIADILKVWQKELTWIVDSFHRTFYPPLTRVLGVFPMEDLPALLSSVDRSSGNFAGKAADTVMRDILGSTVGPIELDNILVNLIASLSAPDGGDRIFNPGEATETDIDFLGLDELEDGDAMRLAPLIGTKAKNLVYLRNSGLPVPPGVVFLSRGANDYEDYTESKGFASALTRAVKKLEEMTGCVFGGEKKPLFLSVRSGSYISMPGVLSSILYCGMNRKTIRAFTENGGNVWTAWDSYRRFLFHYGTIVHGLDAGMFEDVTDRFLRESGCEKSEDLGAESMKQLAALYLRELESRDLAVPENVYEQLREAVKAVYGSWHSNRADQFRKALDVSEFWGTSVLLVKMISGNSRGSGASVFFTRNPSTLEKGAFGDTRENATGDDLVYGRFINRPLARGKAPGAPKSLEEADPEMFTLHLDLADRIERAMRGLPQEVEVTYTRGPGGRRSIYVLQTRRMEFHRGFTKSFQDVCRMEESIIGRGVGVHGGALSGLATFVSSPEDIRRIRKELNMPLILLRKTASTDDVSLMPEIDGILTSSGGATSHASVLAQKFDVAAVVGCSGVVIRADESGNPYAEIGNYTVTEGTAISIDGSTGLVYSGTCFLTRGEDSHQDLA